MYIVLCMYTFLYNMESKQEEKDKICGSTVWHFNLAKFYFGDWRFEIKMPFLKPPIINAHAHSNAHVHQIAKLKTTNYIFMG